MLTGFFVFTILRNFTNMKKKWAIKDRVDNDTFRKACAEAKSMAEAASSLGLHFNSFKKRALEPSLPFQSQIALPEIAIARRILSGLGIGSDFRGVHYHLSRKRYALTDLNDPAEEGSRSGPKSQLVGTHTAQRSAATNLSLQGVSLKIIAELGGWEKSQTLRLSLRQCGIDTAIVASGLNYTSLMIYNSSH